LHDDLPACGSSPQIRGLKRKTPVGESSNGSAPAADGKECYDKITSRKLQKSAQQLIDILEVETDDSHIAMDNFVSATSIKEWAGEISKLTSRHQRFQQPFEDC
jgi:hypothetical protein